MARSMKCLTCPMDLDSAQHPFEYIKTLIEEKKHYHQFILSKEECGFFHELRHIAGTSSLITPSGDYELQQTINFHASSGGRSLGRYDISAANLVLECVRLGAELRKKLSRDGCRHTSDAVASGPIDDLVSNLDSQSVGNGYYSDHTAAAADDDEPTSWKAVKEDIIPSYVNEVSFAIREDEMTLERRKALERQFPDVAIRLLPVTTHQSAQVMPAQEKPKGVKNATFELEVAKIKDDPRLEDSLREQFPWASLILESNSASQQQVPSIGNDGVSQPRTGPAKHLVELAQYIMASPGVEEFGYQYHISKEFNSLPFSRKMAIAHARAIQGRHGRTQSSSQRCTHCVSKGYTCRIYRPKIAQLSHLDFGHDCQNCRLWEETCSLTLSKMEKSSHKELGTRLDASPTNNLSLNTRVDTCSSNEGSTTPSRTTLARKTRLADRITRGDVTSKRRMIGDEAEVGDQSEEQAGTDKIGNSLSQGPQGSVSDKLITEIADRIGLQLPRLDMISSIYTEWLQTKEIRPYKPGRFKLDHYYSNLIDLYIIASSRGMTSLNYAVLLQFQSTNYQHTAGMPDIPFIVKAFQFLPGTSPLCRWIIILYAYLWNTEDMGDCEEFSRKYKELDPSAVAQFLYGIALERCAHTRGRDAAVLNSWCEVHDHTPRSLNERYCLEAKAKNKVSLAEATEAEEERRLNDAKDVIKKWGGSVRMKGDVSDLKQSLSNGKRKATNLGGLPIKRKKGRGGHGFRG